MKSSCLRTSQEKALRYREQLNLHGQGIEQAAGRKRERENVAEQKDKIQTIFEEWSHSSVKKEAAIGGILKLSQLASWIFSPKTRGDREYTDDEIKELSKRIILIWKQMMTSTTLKNPRMQKKC